GLDIPRAGYLQKRTQRSPHRNLVDTGPADAAGDAEDPRVAEIAIDDVEHIQQGLGVVDQRRLAEEPDLDRERRLVAGLSPLPFDRVEERRLLAADVGAGSAPHLELDPEQLPRLRDSVSDATASQRVL